MTHLEGEAQVRPVSVSILTSSAPWLQNLWCDRKQRLYSRGWHVCMCASSEATVGGGVVNHAADSEEVPPQVTLTGASGNTQNGHVTRCDVTVDSVFVCAYPGMLLVYVIIPTIPLLLLILVAAGTCCFQTLSRR